MNLKLLSILALFSFFTFNAHASGSSRPMDRAAMEHYQDLIAGKFDKLEQDSARFRTEGTVLSDGQPHLAAFYTGVAGCNSHACSLKLSEQEWQRRHDQLVKWKKQYPKSVTAQLAYAGYFLERGWSIRGSGYAHTVTKDAWEQYYEHLNLSKEHLVKIYDHAKGDPVWYKYMLHIGVGSGWKKDVFGKVYEEGIKNHPQYLPLYFVAAAYYSPRWNGSSAELKDYINGAVKYTRPFWGDTLHARLNWSLWTTDMFKNGQTEWPQMKKGFEQIIAKYPDAWNINNYAKFSCFAPDPHTLSRLLERIDSKPITEAWGNEAYFHQCVAYAKRVQGIRR